MKDQATRSGAGAWLVLGGAVLWGTTGTAQAFAPQGAQPATVGAVRLAIGGIALLALAVTRGAFRGGVRWPFWATAVAAGSMALYQPLFFAGVARTGVAVGTMVTIGSAPILAGVLGAVVRRERPSHRWAVATLLAIAGCCLLLVRGSHERVDSSGVLLALGAGASYATYAVSSKQLLDQHRPEAVIAVVFCLGALILSPLLFGADLRWLVEPRGLWVALHLGLVATALSYVLFARGLQAVPVASAVTLSLAEPLTAGLLGVLVLGEQLSGPAVLGMGLVFGGLALLTTAGRAPHPIS